MELGPNRRLLKETWKKSPSPGEVVLREMNSRLIQTKAVNLLLENDNTPGLKWVFRENRPSLTQTDFDSMTIGKGGSRYSDSFE